jgi:undecaprenyl-diphosphatase
MDFLLNVDRALFEQINGVWTNALFDWFFPRITDLHKEPLFLAALLPLIAIWIWKKRAFAVRALIMIVLAVGLSDLASYRVVKAAVERPRPLEAGVPVQLRTPHHSGTSFPSNHATNVFAAAQALTFLFPAGAPAFFALAFAVAYSRVYVGVHYPLDVICGALLGVAIAWIVWRSLRKWVYTGKFKTHSAPT